MTLRRQALRTRCILIFLLFVTQFAIAQSVKRRLLAQPVVIYPPIARAARVSGDVVVEYVITKEGSVRDIRVVSGPEMLRGAAIDSVVHWRFAEGETLGMRSTIRFISANGGDYVDDPVQTPVIRAGADGLIVTVTAQLGADKTRSDCPPQSEYPTPVAKTPNDWVEVERTGCYGSCPSYVVRVGRNGVITWTGRAYVSKKGYASARLPPEKAQALIKSLDTRSFWSACGLYSRSVTDMPAQILRAKIGSVEKTVVDYADAAPAELQGFEDKIDVVAGSRRWIKR